MANAAGLSQRFGHGIVESRECKMVKERESRKSTLTWGNTCHSFEWPACMPHMRSVGPSGRVHAYLTKTACDNYTPDFGYRLHSALLQDLNCFVSNETYLHPSFLHPALKISVVLFVKYIVVGYYTNVRHNALKPFSSDRASTYASQFNA